MYRHNQQAEKIKWYRGKAIISHKHDPCTLRVTTRETSQAAERRPGQILKGHDLAEDSIIQAKWRLHA